MCFLTLEQAAVLTGVSAATLRRQVAAGVLPVFDPLTGATGPAAERSAVGGTPPAQVLIPVEPLVRLVHARPGRTPDPVRDEAEQLWPRGQYDPSTRFGRRLVEDQWVRRYLAVAAVREFARADHEVFIADGTQGVWMYLALARWRGENKETLRKIWTNSVIVANEHVLGGSTIQVIAAGGEVDPDYAGIHGLGSFVSRAASHAHVAYLSGTGFTPERGLFARHPSARRVKEVLLGTARHCVIVLRASVLAMDLAEHDPVLSYDDWQQRVGEKGQKVTVVLEDGRHSADGRIRAAFETHRIAEQSFGSGEHPFLSIKLVSVPESEVFRAIRVGRESTAASGPRTVKAG